MQELLTMATGKKLSPQAFLEDVLLTEEEVLVRARKRLQKMEEVPVFSSTPSLDAHVRIYDGKYGRYCITHSGKGWDRMCFERERYITKRVRQKNTKGT